MAGDPGSPGVFYFGACGGGVWKTTDGGAYWHNVSDGFFRTASVGALAVAHSDPNVVYAGMGEACVRNDVSYGDGVYRSTDAGRTWVHRGLEATRHIARVRVHPHDPSVVYVAALGDIFGPSPDRGVYRSTDGGRTWTLVLSRDERSGAADLWLDPANPSILYATIWEAVRRPWSMVSGGPGSGLFRSTDGGDTWTELTSAPGLPAGPLGRIGVAGAARRPGRVWALVEAAGDAGGVYRSEDGGDSWARASDNKGVQGRPWYYSHLVADPPDPDTLWSLNFGLWRSIDGGASFDPVTTPHGDNHDIWIDPSDPRRMIEGNDGGACVSFNGGETFSTIFNQPTSAFYHLTVDSHFPYRVSATQQDNSAIRVPSRSREGAIPWEQCEPVGTSESGYIAVDPEDDEVIFSGAVGSAGGGGAPLIRHDHRLRQDRLVTIWPELTTGEDPAGFKHRFNWTYPILFSPRDPKALYAGGERVFRSRDGGDTWEAISPDLTHADPETLRASGEPITKDTSGAEVYATISCLAWSPAGDTLWAGTDDGRVHRTDDEGASWTDVTPAQLPERAWVTCIEPDPRQPGTAYLTATRYRLQDRTPYLLVTHDSGKTWTPATAGIEPDDYLRIVRADPARRGVLYAGSETRSYFSHDGAQSWHSLRLNMPAVPIYDLAIVGDELVAASHGRGFWVLDGLHVLGNLTELGASSAASLLAPDVTYRFPTPAPRLAAKSALGLQYLGTAVALRAPGGLPADEKDAGRAQAPILNGGDNPPDGVTVRYFLPQSLAYGSLRLTVLN
ncbi:MAG: WD40/YVTN/BNR-like repeat-containing protein, partial [Candidatus Dormibacteraceae bacterium]